MCTESNENRSASDKTRETRQQNGTVSKQTSTLLQLSSFAFWRAGGEGEWGVCRGLGDKLNSPFTSLLLAVSSLPAPCLPTSSRGSFLSLSPSILTRTTPDLSTISWMTLPLLPMTLPVQEIRDVMIMRKYIRVVRRNVLRWWSSLLSSTKWALSGMLRSSLTYKVPGYLKVVFFELKKLSSLLYCLWSLQHNTNSTANYTSASINTLGQVLTYSGPTMAQAH